MTDEPEPRRPPRAAALLALVGGLALLGAMATDFIAVIGRHTGLSLFGAIEIVQALVLVSGAIAIVIATVERSHAVVHLLIDRLAPRAQRLFGRINGLFSILFFLAAAGGSAVIAADMIGAHEESELLGIPMMPLRIVCTLCIGACAALFLRDLAGRSRP